jgi:hypothetical protein
MLDGGRCVAVLASSWPSWKLAGAKVGAMVTRLVNAARA